MYKCDETLTYRDRNKRETLQEFKSNNKTNPHVYKIIYNIHIKQINKNIEIVDDILVLVTRLKQRLMFPLMTGG